MLFLTLLALYAGNATAQITRLEGQVFDKQDGEPLIGVTVMVDGTHIATVTDLDGKFSLAGLTPDHQKITVTYIGYEKQTLDAKPDMKIYLETKSEMMDEVIVVAFGKQKRESFTGSASVISATDITRQQVNSPVDALKGMVAGLQMTDNNSFSSDARPTIRIRGFSSLNASNEPLIVVDGLPYSGYLNDLNPADIENMTVLKDAASNALYGARGANGVIMITTKSAQRGNTKVNFEAKWGANTNGRIEYDIIDNPGEYYEAYYLAAKNNYQYRSATPLPFEQAHLQANQVLGRDREDGGLGYIVYDVPQGELLIGSNGRLNPHAVLGNRIAYNNEIYTLYPDDWYEAGTRNGFRQEYNVNITGGNDKYSMLASMGYLSNEGVSKGADLERFNARIKMNYQAYDFLRVGASAGYTNTNTNSQAQVFATRYSIAPIYPLYIRDGNGNILYDSHGPRFDNGNELGINRPVDSEGNLLQDQRYNISQNSSNAYNIQGFATFDFLKDFHFTVNGSVYITENRGKSAYNPWYGYNVNDGGGTSIGHYRTTDVNYQQLLNYNPSFGPHSLDILVGHEYSRSMGTGLWATANNIANYEDNTEISGAINFGNPSSYKSLYNVEGYFGRVQYDYDNRYFGSFSYRRDGSSRFHPDHRWGNFWSIGGAWILSKEEWFPKNPYINMLKFKVSYGEQGNDGIGNFRYVDMYNITNSNDNIAYTFASKGSEDITWETVGNFNTGFEFTAFNNRLNGGLEYYWRKTTNMLMYFSSPWEIGYDGYYDNVGDMTNTGIEVNLNADIIRTRDFTWNFGLNLAWQVNRITYIPSGKAGNNIDGHKGYIDGGFYYGEGLPMYSFYCKRYAGVNENGQALYYRKGENDQLETTTDFQLGDYFICGNAMPKVFGGFNTSFSFRGIDLSAQFNYSIGGKKWDTGYQSLMASPNSVNIGSGIHRDVFKSWTPENPDSDIPMFYYNDVYSGATTDRFLKNANYLSMSNLSIGYTFPKSFANRLKMSNLRVFGACENVAYWTARKGFDPRASLTSGSYGGYVPLRTISGGLQIQF